MLFELYLFCLIVGGGLVALSLVSGVGETEADVEAGEVGGDLDADLDADMDAEFGGDLGAGELDVGAGDMGFDELPFEFDLEGADVDADADLDSGGGEMEYEVSRQRRFNPLTSLKFWTFSAAFFGLTGTIFEGFGLIGSDLAIAGLSSMVGLAMGVVMAYLIHTADEGAGEGLTERDYLGASAEVRVPVREGKPGNVRLELESRLIDKRAQLMEGESDLERGDNCFVIGLAGEEAKVVSASSVVDDLTDPDTETDTVLEDQAEREFDEKLERERKQQTEHAKS